MVEVALHHAAVALQVRSGKERVLRQRSRAVAHAVGLDVAFVHHIQAILVAEGEPARVVGIMAGADGVDVQFLHDPDVADHLGLGDDIAAGGAQLMPVGALDEDGLSIDHQLVADDLHSTETERDLREIDGLLASIGPDGKRVQVRILRAPESRVQDLRFDLRHPVHHFDPVNGKDTPAVRVNHLQVDQADALGNLHTGLQATIGPAGDMDIFDPLFLTGVDFHPAGDAGEAPEILILQVGAVAPAEDFQGDGVLPRMDIFREVEAGFELAVLAVAHHLAVHPHADVGGGGADVQADLLPDRSGRSKDSRC